MIRPDELRAAFEVGLEEDIDRQLVESMVRSDGALVHLHIFLQGETKIEMFEENLLPRYAEFYDVKKLTYDRHTAMMEIRSGTPNSTYIFSLKEGTS